MRLALVAFALLIAWPSARSAAAQELVSPEARQGYYVGGGLRSGMAAADGLNVGGLGALTHFGGWFRVGQKALPWLGLGLSFGGGNESNDDWRFGYGGLLVEADFEPFPALDLAIRVGTGVGGGGLSRQDPGLESDDDPGFAFGPLVSFGVSYEWFPLYQPGRYDSGGLGLGAFVEGRFFPGGDVTSGGGFIGLEFTYWTGLPDRKLVLPVEEAFD